MAIVSVTSTWINNIKVKRTTDFADSNCKHLYVRVGAKDKRTGKHHKSFVFRKRYKYQQIIRTIGSYPEMSIDEARQRALQLNLDVVNGLITNEPSLEELKEFKGSISKQFASKKTLGALLEAYADDLKVRGKKSARAVRVSLTTNVKSRFPELWNKTASEITSEDIFNILKHPTLLKAKSNYNLVRGYLFSAFKKAKSSDFSVDGSEKLKGFGIEFNPVADIEKRKVAVQISKDYFLTEKQLKRFAELIDTIPDERNQTFAKILLLLGGQRPEQLRNVTEDRLALDKGDAWIKIIETKGSNNDAGKSHDIPLTPMLIKLFQSLSPFESGYVFEAMFRRREAGKPETYEMGQLLETDYFNEAIFKPIAKQMMAEGSWKSDKPFTINILRKSGQSYLTAKGISREIRNWFYSHNLTGVDYKNYQRYEFQKEKLDCLKLLEKLLP